MSSQLFKQFIKKAILNKQSPPGPPPRKGLEWKSSTRRWVRPDREKHGETEFKSRFDFGRVNPSSPEYQERHERMSSGYVRQKPPKENLPEWMGVKNQVKVLANVLPDIAKYGIKFESWGTPAVKFVENALADIEEKIGYNSHEAVHESGEGGQTELQIMVDQVYGALESQSAFGGLQGGTWEELIGEVNEHLSGIPETKQEKAQKFRDQKRKEEEATREPYDPSSPESLRRRAENRRSREALEAARSEAIRRNPGTDPSWYGR